MPFTELISLTSANETLGTSSWPRVFSPSMSTCPECFGDLTVQSQRNRQDQRSSLIIRLVLNIIWILNKILKQLFFSINHVIPVQVMSQRCKKCCLVFFQDTTVHGLLNIGGILLIAFDVFYMMEGMLKRGLPLQAAASTVVSYIEDHTEYFVNQAE